MTYDPITGAIRPISAEPIRFSAEQLAKAVRAFSIAHRICPYCHGVLSSTRIQNGRRLRHCYSCHFEFEEEEE